MRPSGPAINGVAVTPSDTTILNCRALWVGTTGNLTVDFADGNSDVLIKNVPVGVFPFAVKRVKAATTAEDIVAFF